jgi:hypothetical protein
MKSAKILGFILASFLTACASNTGGSSSGVSCPAANTSCTSAAGPTAIPTSTSATLPLYVADTSTTGQWGYQNEPLVSVTICTPGHTSSSQCQTISNVLLDTGSYGLRVFASAITNTNVQLQQQTVTVQGETMNLAECATFGSGADWGSVQNGDVVLGNQTATNIPIHVIDYNYASIPSGCADLCPDTDPCTAGFNGILGVGVFTQDCGTACDSNDDSVNPGNYFACDSSGCYDGYYGGCGSDGVCMFQISTAQQVVNPVYSSGNNGVSLTLPSIGTSGASAVTSGTVTLGISSATGVTVYGADSNGMTDYNGADFTTTFDGTTYGGSANSGSSASFIDSGSNWLYFPSASIASCSDNSLYCPGSTQSLSATVAGYNGSPTGTASFSIVNADSIVNNGNTAYSNIGAPMSNTFDWGLPFFYGKTIYVGIDGSTATINGSTSTGPYWAF